MQAGPQRLMPIRRLVLGASVMAGNFRAPSPKGCPPPLVEGAIYFTKIAQNMVFPPADDLLVWDALHATVTNGLAKFRGFGGLVAQRARFFTPRFFLMVQ